MTGTNDLVVGSVSLPYMFLSTKRDCPARRASVLEACVTLCLPSVAMAVPLLAAFLAAFLTALLAAARAA